MISKVLFQIGFVVWMTLLMPGQFVFGTLWFYAFLCLNENLAEGPLTFLCWQWSALNDLEDHIYNNRGATPDWVR